jgi:hypothetical protein
MYLNAYVHYLHVQYLDTRHKVVSHIIFITLSITFH